jgi:hypothetical protein
MIGDRATHYSSRRPNSETSRSLSLTGDRLASCQRAFFDACVAAGYPADHSSPMGGVELGCANIVGTTRWNAAFAFLDPVRELPTLKVEKSQLVERDRPEWS